MRVALAGQDLDLAKLAARRVPRASEWQKRQLWQRIAEVAVREIVYPNLNKNLLVLQAETLEPPDLLLLLEESNGVLRLHESLRFVSSSGIIGSFRSELCAAFDAAETKLNEKQADIEHNRRALASLKAKLRAQEAA